MSCSEVSGLEMEYDIIEYRAGDSPVFTKQKMPGLRKAGEVTLKKGIFKDDKAMWDWINKVKLNTIQRETVTINLLDESGSPVKTWEVVNARWKDSRPTATPLPSRLWYWRTKV